METGPFLGVAIWLLLQGTVAAQQSDVLSPAPTSVSSPVTQPPAPPRVHSLGLDVTSEKHGGASNNADARQTSGLGYHPTHTDKYGTTAEALNITTDQAKLKVSVRNFGLAPDIAVLECYFFGERLGDLEPKTSPLYDEKQSRQFIFDHPTQTLNIPTGAPDAVSVESKELRTIVEKSTAFDGHTTSNFKHEASTQLRGWMVRLVADGKVLAVRASNTTYENLGKDEAKLAAYLALKPPREESRRRTIGPFRQSQ